MLPLVEQCPLATAKAAQGTGFFPHTKDKSPDGILELIRALCGDFQNRRVANLANDLIERVYLINLAVARRERHDDPPESFPHPFKSHTSDFGM